jgi:hypothetical protein
MEPFSEAQKYLIGLLLFEILEKLSDNQVDTTNIEVIIERFEEIIQCKLPRF